MKQPKRRPSHAPQVPFNQRQYEARKAQILASDASPKEKEQRLRAAATYCKV